MRRGLPLAAALTLAVAGPAYAETANRIVAVVNDDIVTVAEVAEHLQAYLAQREDDSPEPDPGQLQKMILRRLIERRLILQEAKRLGIPVTSDDVAERLDAFRARFGGEDEFRRWLAEAGMSQEQFKEQLRDELLVERAVYLKVRSTISVSPQDVARELAEHPELVKGGDRVRAFHILIRVSEDRSEEKASALAARLREEIVGGADFGELAKRYSEDSHAKHGGDLGWTAQGELLPELDQTLFTLKEGEVSLPIASRLGFHLVKVGQRRTAESLSVTEANHAVYQRLFQRKFEETFDRWMKDLSRKAYIELVPPEGRIGG